MKKQKALRFEEFIGWLKKRCRTRYRTANLGHRGNGIAAIYSKGVLHLEWGNKGGKGKMKKKDIALIFERFLELKKKRAKAGQYAHEIFMQAPDMIMTPFVPALIRDYEYEQYVAGKI